MDGGIEITQPPKLPQPPVSAMDVDVQALCVEGGDAGRNDQTTGEHEPAIDASLCKVQAQVRVQAQARLQQT